MEYYIYVCTAVYVCTTGRMVFAVLTAFHIEHSKLAGLVENEGPICSHGNGSLSAQQCKALLVPACFRFAPRHLDSAAPVPVALQSAVCGARGWPPPRDFRGSARNQAGSQFSSAVLLTNSSALSCSATAVQPFCSPAVCLLLCSLSYLACSARPWLCESVAQGPCQ